MSLIRLKKKSPVVKRPAQVSCQSCNAHLDAPALPVSRRREARFRNTAPLDGDCSSDSPTCLASPHTIQVDATHHPGRTPLGVQHEEQSLAIVDNDSKLWRAVPYETLRQCESRKLPGYRFLRGSQHVDDGGCYRNWKHQLSQLQSD